MNSKIKKIFLLDFIVKIIKLNKIANSASYCFTVLVYYLIFKKYYYANCHFNPSKKPVLRNSWYGNSWASCDYP